MLFYFNIVQSYHIAVMKAVRGRLYEGAAFCPAAERNMRDIAPIKR